MDFWSPKRGIYVFLNVAGRSTYPPVHSPLGPCNLNISREIYLHLHKSHAKDHGPSGGLACGLLPFPSLYSLWQTLLSHSLPFFFLSAHSHPIRTNMILESPPLVNLTPLTQIHEGRRRMLPRPQQRLLAVARILKQHVNRIPLSLLFDSTHPYP